MSLSVTQVVNALLCSDEPYCLLDQSGVVIVGVTNTMNMRWSEAVTVSLFFLPFYHAINLTTPTHRHFLLYPVSLELRDQDGGPSNSTIAISRTSRKNRGLCSGQSNFHFWGITLSPNFHYVMSVYRSLSLCRGI